MRVYELDRMSLEDETRLLQRAETRINELMAQVEPVVEEVRSKGDRALLEYTRKFDGVEMKGDQLKVADEEFKLAHDSLDPSLTEAIALSYRNIKKYHQMQMPVQTWYAEISPGITAGEKTTPVTSVGLYVPRGKGSFPSVTLMLGVPAMVAGVEEIVICTPPGPDREVDAASLVAADMCGIRDVYRVGGAQAMAALAYGTETIPRVQQILGPGSGYVSAAKRLLYGQVDVGLPAGPSDSIILADESASPGIVAADLLIEAEHGPDSCALLVTDSRELAEKVKKILPGLIDDLPQPRKDYCRQVFQGYGGIVLTRSVEESAEFVNRFAPEHLELLVHDPFVTLNLIKNAGEVLLGHYTPISLSNYSMGPNAILPTGGFARSYSAVSIMDFLKRTTIAHADARGFAELSKAVIALAEYEGFPAHARAIEEREKEQGESR